MSDVEISNLLDELREKKRKSHRFSVDNRSGRRVKNIKKLKTTIHKFIPSHRIISKKKLAIFFIALFIAATPIFIIQNLALLGCNFEINKLSISYTEPTVNTSNSIVNLYLPIYNPNFVPAYIGEINLDLLDSSGYKVGNAYTNIHEYIMPHQELNATLNLDLNKSTAGPWISNIFKTMKLDLVVKNLKYNGVSIPGTFKIPSIDISGFVKSLFSGFSFNHMIESLTAPSSENELFTQNNNDNNPQSNSTDNTYVDISESKSAINIATSEKFYIAPNPRFNIGTIKIFNLTAGLYVDTSNNYGSSTNNGSLLNYNYPLITISGLPSNNSTTSGLNGDINIVFGGTSELNLNVSIHKDNIGINSIDPSANVNWADPIQVSSFIQQAKQKDPLYYFLYQLIEDGSINCALAVTNMNIEIFGILVPNISIPADLLGTINIQNKLNIQDLINNSLNGGIFGGIGAMLNNAATGGLSSQNLVDKGIHVNIPKSSNAIDTSTFSNILDLESLSNFNLSSISESWGSNANLTLNLPIGIRNFPIGISAGLSGAKFNLFSSINGKEGNFGTAFICSNDSLNPKTVYFNGEGSNSSMIIDFALYKNSTIIPFTTKFLGDLLENSTLNANAVLNIDKLLLFEQNYTFPGITLKMPLNLNVDYIGNLVSSAVKNYLTNTFDSNSIIANNSSLSSESGNNKTNNLSDSIDFLSLFRDLSLKVNNTSNETNFDVEIRDLNVSNIFPFTLGLYPSNLAILSQNEYGNWTKIMEIKNNNYFALGPNTGPMNISLSLMVYNSDALNNFIHQFLYRGIISIILDGDVSLNVSGIDLPHLHLSLPLENIETGFNLTLVLDNLIENFNDTEINQTSGSSTSTATSAATSDTQWWDSLFQVGSFKINSISATKLLSLTSGTISVQASIPLTNNLMDLSINQLDAEIFYSNNSMNDPNSLMAKIQSSGVYLGSGVQNVLKLNITIYKSNYTQVWLNDVTQTLNLSGYVKANVSVNVFNCTIGPLYLSADASIGLYAIFPNIASVLDSINSFLSLF